MACLAFLWKPPQIDPGNSKARTIPFLNPFTDIYGRVMFFSWFGFLVAFASWYAFNPLLYGIIDKDLNLNPVQVANSQIFALSGPLIARLFVGFCCDYFGPRLTFAGCLVAGAIPTLLASVVRSATGLYAIRFFIGILGACFVPCQTWTVSFFDDNTIGTANGLAAGLGNLGGGASYLLMPMLFNAFINSGFSISSSWRLSFIVPGVVLISVALCMIFMCPDTPLGPWGNRSMMAEEARAQPSRNCWCLHRKRNFGALFSSPTLVLAACYFSMFGSELFINSILGKYYKQRCPNITLRQATNWASVFGLTNGIARPLGGYISDLAYRYSSTLWARKAIIHIFGFCGGISLIILGVLRVGSFAGALGNVTVVAIALQTSNGATFSLVPRVHPSANGIVTGVVGAAGNLGGVVFAILSRYSGEGLNRVFLIVGIIVVGTNVLTSWIRPVLPR